MPEYYHFHTNDIFFLTAIKISNTSIQRGTEKDTFLFFNLMLIMNSRRHDLNHFLLGISII